jgi:hypothetical protein
VPAITAGIGQMSRRMAAGEDDEKTGAGFDIEKSDMMK